MPTDIAESILRSSLRAPARTEKACATCRRTPVTGELLHVFEGGRSLCTLCVGALPAAEREPLRRERVHASIRRLDVMPRAA